jgi:L-ascorbate metabolism protein UlaG (beta-lactamase superfamily)
MLIRWYGQSAFLLAGREHRVLIDPFGAMEQATERGIRFEYPPVHDVAADLLLITHEHFDHNYAAAAIGSPPTIRSTAGTLASPLGEVTAIASEHDPEAGTQRGPNTIFRFPLDGLRVCHMGDFGQRVLRDEQRKAIGEPDLLMLPVGGGTTAGAVLAAEIVAALRPRIVVPMHYRTEAIGFLEPPDKFLAAVEVVAEAELVRLDSSEFNIADEIGEHGRPSVVLPAPPLGS